MSDIMIVSGQSDIYNSGDWSVRETWTIVIGTENMISRFGSQNLNNSYNKINTSHGNETKIRIQLF